MTVSGASEGDVLNLPLGNPHNNKTYTVLALGQQYDTAVAQHYIMYPSSTAVQAVPYLAV